MPPLASAEAVSLFCERSRLEPSAEIAELCAVSTTFRSPSSSPPLARKRSLQRRSWNDSPSASTCYKGGGTPIRASRRSGRRSPGATTSSPQEERRALPNAFRLRRGLHAGGGGGGRRRRSRHGPVARREEPAALRGASATGCWRRSGSLLDRRSTLLSERELKERHADYYVALGEEAKPHWRVDPKDWLDVIEAELDNFRGALDYLETANPFRQLRLAVSIGRDLGYARPCK